MVKCLYTDPIDWDSPELLRIQSTMVLLCEHVFGREDVSNTSKSNGYIEFYWRFMSPTSTNVDSLRNDMSFFCCLAAVSQSSQICKKIFTVVTKL